MIPMTRAVYEFPPRTPRAVELVKPCDLCETTAMYRIERPKVPDARVVRACVDHVGLLVQMYAECFGFVTVARYDR